MYEYSEAVALRDGSQATVRTTSPDDLRASLTFFLSMPEEEKQQMRIDVCDEETVARRYESIEKGKTVRLVAVCGDKIVGEGSLETMRYGWLRKSGEVRLLILPEYRDLDVAKIMAREIFLLAARHGLNNLITRVRHDQTEMIEIFKGLHFRHEATQRDQVVDPEGWMHDLYMFTFDLAAMWRDLEDAVSSTASRHMDY